MVAIVSGSGLGLSLSSLAAIGQQGVRGSASQGSSAEQAFVNIADGNLVLQNRDDHLASVGNDITSLRTYNSEGSYTTGDNWNFGVNRQVLAINGALNGAGSTITKTNSDGASSVYTYNSTSMLYVNSDNGGANDTISYNSTAQQLTWISGTNGSKEVYESTGLNRLVSTIDAVGNTNTYTYVSASSNLLSQVVDASGETTYLDYTGTNLSQIRVASQAGATTTRVHYTFDTSNRLSTVTVDLSPIDNAITDGKIYATTYTYDGTSNRVASITQSDGTSQAFTYVLVGTDYRVA